jgi:hypothetical protein
MSRVSFLLAILENLSSYILHKKVIKSLKMHLREVN